VNGLRLGSIPYDPKTIQGCPVCVVRPRGIKFPISPAEILKSIDAQIAVLQVKIERMTSN